MKPILSFLKDFNDNYAQLALFVIALISFVVAYQEFIGSRRPYVVPEIQVRLDESGDKWYFDIALVNKGERPGIAKITNAILQIGDESYPTLFQTQLILSPDERGKLAPIGNINSVGRQKIRGHEYKENRVEIRIEVASRALEDKEFPYTTSVTYKVDVTGTTPVVQLIEENLN